MYHTTCEVRTQDEDQHAAQASELNKPKSQRDAKERMLHILKVVANVYLHS